MNDKKIIDNKEVYNNFLDRAVAMAKQGKRPNILTPAFYDAVRIGKKLLDLSQEEVYNHIEQKLEGEMKEQATEKDLDTQKELNKELEKTQDLQKKIKDISENDAVAKIPNSALTAINQQVKNPATMAALVLDFIEKVQEKESIKFENNSKFKQAIQRLEDLARSTNREDTKDMEEVKESLVKEITKRVKQKLSEATKEEETEFHKKLDKLVHDTFGKRKEELGEAKLDFMGTADEETMKYLQEISREELVALEKQFVEMFDTLGEIRYNASEQLSKGASEISQRIHNFITIFRQVLKGYPVVKEDISRDTRAYMLDKKLDYDKIKALEKQMVEVSRILDDLEKNGGDPLSSKAAKAGDALGQVTYIFRQMLRDIDNDRISKEFETGTYESKSLTNNHSNPVLEAAKKKLVDRINSIALKEGISKKEATIRVVKALKESK